MAYDAIETICRAELTASERIDNAHKCSDNAVTKAKEKSNKILTQAQKDVNIFISHTEEELKARAEEIVTTEYNKALIEADNLRKKCFKRQEEVNELILSLIIGKN